MRRISFINLLLIAALIMSCARSLAGDLTMSSFSMSGLSSTGGQMAGESQSTVVAPGLKNECPAGRFLVSLDANRVPGFDGSNGSNDALTDTDLVRYMDFQAGGYPSGSAHRSLFVLPTAGELTYMSFVSNDHDLVSLPNGDILYVFAIAYRAPTIHPTPIWFNFTYRNAFGPGARGAVIIFRSRDCGNTFSMVGVFETGDFPSSQNPPLQNCSFPQTDGMSVATWKAAVGWQTPPPPPAAGAPKEPYYFDMGGPDGQEIVVDRWAHPGRIYLTSSCVGNMVIPPPPSSGTIDLSDTPVNRTVVAYSDDEGASWSAYLWLPGVYWRLGFVPSLIAQSGVGAFIAGTNLVIVSPPWNGAGPPPGPTQTYDLTQGRLGTGSMFGNVTTSANFNILAPSLNNNCLLPATPPPLPFPPVCGIFSNIYESPVIAGAGSGFVMAVPWDIPSQSHVAHGYRVFYYSTHDRSITEEIPPILPTVCCNSSNGFILHAVAVSVGDSALLYWTDVNADTHRASVRARFIKGKGNWNGDWSIMGPPLVPWDTTKTLWYGDYQTAGGFVLPPANGKNVYVAFPMWVQSDGTIDSTRLQFEVPQGPGGGNTQDALVHVSPKIGWPVFSTKFLRRTHEWGPRSNGIETRAPDLR